MKINTNLLKDSNGIVYILYIDIVYEDKTYEVTKIGVTERKVEDRVVEILTSIWKKTRYFPKCYVKRYKTVDSPYALEAKLLSMFPDRLDIGFKFSGSTECFIIDEKSKEELISKYEEFIDSASY